MNTPIFRNWSLRKTIIAGILFILISGATAYALDTSGVISVFGSRVVTQPTEAIPSTPTDVRPTTTIEYKPDPPSTQPTIPDKDPGLVKPLPSLGAAGVTITRINQTASTLQIRALIDGVTSGTCSAVLTQNTVSISQTSPISLQANQHGCGSLDIALSRFSQSGTWSLALTVVSDSGENLATAEESVIITL